jgi:hypothetical protein
MIRLVSEIETAEQHHTTADTGSLVRLVLSYADKGMFDFKLSINGRRWTVNQLVRRWHLSSLVNYQKNGETI